ncbi:MAG: hypothetical protein CMH57_06995 [Myxococcales bacterium]|nr:hypothetical protein [Myxococcales bacterium]
MTKTSLWLLSVVLLTTGALSCSDSGSGAASNPDEQLGDDALTLRREVLGHLGESVILVEYRAFEQAAEALEQASGAWAESGADADRQAAQEAWRAAMSQWQRCELLQVGPAGLMGTVAGGEDLRDEIYSWPLTNPCRVDQEVVEAAFDDPTAFAEEPVNVRGLDALEYLLFSASADNACAPNSAINRDGAWAALSADELAGRRARYSRTLAADLRARAAALRTAWEAEGGNFLLELREAGASSQTYPSTQDALNALSDAMFYLEKETKDMKLAIPAGLSDACSVETCPEDLESPYAQHSKENIIANLRSFRLMLLGAEPGVEAPGFDDLLIIVGAEEVLTALVEGIDAAMTALEAIDGTMAEALATNPESVVTAYEALQSMLVEFKTRFIGVLDLEIPQRAEGDND